MSLSRLSLGNLKVSELGTGESQKVLKSGGGHHEVVQCRRLSSFCKAETRGCCVKEHDMK